MMTVKTNNATNNRPDGKRLIDAPAVMVDMTVFIKQLKQEPAWGKSDRNSITVFKTPGLTMVLNAFHGGAEIKDFQLEGILVLQVIEGSIRVSTSDDELILKEKQLLVLHPDLEQQLVAEKETIVLLSAIKDYGDRVL